MRSVRKHEITPEELDQLVKAHPRPLKFDGMRYTEQITMRGLTWRKAIAYVDPATQKCYRLEDR